MDFTDAASRLEMLGDLKQTVALSVQQNEFRALRERWIDFRKFLDRCVHKNNLRDLESGIRRVGACADFASRRDISLLTFNRGARIGGQQKPLFERGGGPRPTRF